MILVFGAGGQLGQSLIEESRRSGVQLVGFTRAQADITNEASVRRAIAATPPALVINAAAFTAVDRAESDAAAAAAGNAVGPAVVASAAAEAGIPIVHISTDYVFAGDKARPYVESDPIAPINVYGQSKARGEEAVRRISPQHIIIRTSWLYGPYGQNFLKTMIRLAASRDELRIVSDQFGSPTSTIDLARAVLRVAERLASDRSLYGTYHFAGQGVTSWYDFATEIIDRQAGFTGKRPRVVPIATAAYPTAARRPVNSALNCSRFDHVFEFRAPPLQASVRTAFERLRSPELAA